jgi:hypothetical protein
MPPRTASAVAPYPASSAHAITIERERAVIGRPDGWLPTSRPWPVDALPHWPSDAYDASCARAVDLHQLSA